MTFVSDGLLGEGGGGRVAGSREKQKHSPEDYTITDRREEGACAVIHGQDMLAVRISFQRSVDPVHKSESLLLCNDEHIQASVKVETQTL